MSTKPAPLYAVVLAGGHGTRLWPLSRKNIPKQLQPILGRETLLKATWKRLRKGMPASRILIVTNAEQAELVRKDLPELPQRNLVVEPMRRDTAAAIGLGVQVVRARTEHATIVTVNSDAYIKDVPEYLRILKMTAEVAQRSPKRLTLIGVRPGYAEAGYGYIKMGSQVLKVPKKDGTHDEVFEVEGFREKPDLRTAMDYVMKWEYLWNPTLIVADAGVFMKAFKTHLPDMHAELERVRLAWKTKKRDSVLREAFQAIKPISIDYGILEHVEKMRVVPADFGWADVGHWRAVHDVLAANEKSNVSRTRHVNVDSMGNLLYSFTGKMIATAGMKDMIIIETEDVILACPKDRAQDVKQIVQEMEKKKLNKYL